MSEKHRYLAWDVSFYNSTTRFFPNEHEVHGPFFADDETDLIAQMAKAGLEISAVRWEIRPQPPASPAPKGET